MYIAILPGGARDEAGGDADRGRRAQIARALGRPGVYAVVAGNQFRAGQRRTPGLDRGRRAATLATRRVRAQARRGRRRGARPSSSTSSARPRANGGEAAGRRRRPRRRRRRRARAARRSPAAAPALFACVSRRRRRRARGGRAGRRAARDRPRRPRRARRRRPRARPRRRDARTPTRRPRSDYGAALEPLRAGRARASTTRRAPAGLRARSARRSRRAATRWPSAKARLAGQRAARAPPAVLLRPAPRPEHPRRRLGADGYAAAARCRSARPTPSGSSPARRR